jgi:hypothetical protein
MAEFAVRNRVAFAVENKLLWLYAASKADRCMMKFPVTVAFA